jgi:hypothetical protein
MRQPAITAPEPGSQVVSSSATRYGVLMGGPKFVTWELVGEMAIGHQEIDRRDLTQFTNIDVGRRNESEATLNDDRPALHMNWYNNPDRIVTKTAFECANDVKTTFGEAFGFVVPEILIGLAAEKADEIFQEVLPREVALGTLKNVITHLSSNTHKGFQAEKLRQELLTAANVCSTNLMKYVTALKAEAGLAREKGTGKRGPDPVEIEYFRELETPLPEEVPALATLAMGQELGKQFASVAGGSDEVLKAILEQNQLLMRSLTVKEGGQAPAQEITTEPASKAAKKDK